MTPHERARRLRGIVLLVLSSSIFAGVDGISKLLADTQSVGQIVWARYALALPVLILTTRPADWAGLFRTARPGLQIAAWLSPLAISASMVMAVRYLPLAEATVILFAGPFLIVALSKPFLGETVRAASWIGVAIGFLAVLIVARPGFSTCRATRLFPLVAAIFFAVYQLITRRLGAAGERPNTTLAWTLAMGGLVATPIALFTWEPVTSTDWLLMICARHRLRPRTVADHPRLHLRAGGRACAVRLRPMIAATIFGIIVFGDGPRRLDLRRHRPDHRRRGLCDAKPDNVTA